MAAARIQQRRARADAMQRASVTRGRMGLNRSPSGRLRGTSCRGGAAWLLCRSSPAAPTVTMPGLPKAVARRVEEVLSEAAQGENGCHDGCQDGVAKGRLGWAAGTLNRSGFNEVVRLEGIEPPALRSGAVASASVMVRCVRANAGAEFELGLVRP